MIFAMWHGGSRYGLNRAEARTFAGLVRVEQIGEGK